MNKRDDLNDFFLKIKLEVLQEKEKSLKQLNEEIYLVNSQYKEELQKISETINNIYDKVRNKISKMLKFYEESYIKNFDGYLEMIENVQDLYRSEDENFETEITVKYLQTMKEILLAQSKNFLKYTSYEDVNHSFNQVITIMRKSFDLFEEHFVDLINFGEIKDLTERNFQEDVFHLIGKNYTNDRTVAFLNSNNFEITFEKEINPQHDYNLNSLVMLDDDLVITSSIDRSIHINSLAKESIISSINNLKFSPMVLCLLKTKKNTPNLHLKNNKNCFSLDKPNDKNHAKHQKFYSNNENCLLATGGGDYDPNIYIWNVKTGKKILNLIGHNRHITTLEQLPDYNILASGGYDSKIFIWDLNAGDVKIIINRHNFWIFKIKVSHNKNYMASCSWDRRIILWRIIYDQKFEGEYRFKDLISEKQFVDEYEICTINFLFSCDNTFINSNIGKYINVWDIKNQKVKQEIKLKQGFANELMILERKNENFVKMNKNDLTGTYVIASSIEDNCLRVFSLLTGEEVFSIQHEILNLNAYNLNPKMQFFQYNNGDLGLVNISHNDKIIKLGLWRIIEKKTEKIQ